MKQLIFIGFILILVSGVQASPPQKEWTLMVYMAADNDLNDFAEFDLIEMIKNKLPASANLIVQIDNSNPCSWADWTACRRLEIKQGLAYKTQYVSDIGEINTGKPAELTKFIDWTVLNYPAQKYGLIVWNHGDGWRLANFEKKQPVKPLYKAIASDSQSGDILYMHEISTALKNCRHNFRQAPFEFIGFDACLMGMMEVWYELKDFARYGIGSEDLEPGVGWPYDKIVDALGKSGSDTKKFCRSIVDSYHEYFSQGPDLYTLSVVDLSKIAALSRELSGLVPALIQQPKVLARSRMKTGEPYAFDAAKSWPNGIDLKKFMEEFRKASPIAGVNTKIDTFIRHYEEAIISNTCDKDNRAHRGSNGMAIYFPGSAAILANDPDADGYKKINNNNPVDFVRNEKWSDLIDYWGKHTVAPDLTDKLISPLDPHPSLSERQLYREMDKIYKSYSPNRVRQTCEFLKKGIVSYKNDTASFLTDLGNVMLAYFESPEYGILLMSGLEDLVTAIKKTLPANSVEQLSHNLSGIFGFITKENAAGTGPHPNYGILGTIGEFVVRLEQDPISRIAMNLAMSDAYAILQDNWYLDNTQVRTALNAAIPDSDAKKDFEADLCFVRANTAYNRTIEFLNSLPEKDNRRGFLSYITYYSLMKLYAHYSFLYNDVLTFITKIEEAIPAYLKRDTISNYERLKIYRNKIIASYRAGKYDGIKNTLPSYYRYIEIERPREKILLENGVIDMERTGSASDIFPNARTFASPARQNEDLTTFNHIISYTYLTSRNASPGIFIDAFEHSHLVESPVNSQLVGTPHESAIYGLINNVDSITSFEYKRILKQKSGTHAIDTSGFSKTNLTYFYYSYFQKTLYILLKDQQRWKIDTIMYPDFFEFNYLAESNPDKKFKMAREEKIYSIINDFFKTSSKKEILVIPHDFLFELPLDGMSDGKDNYLVDKYKFSYAFNLQNKHIPFGIRSKKMLCVSSAIAFSDIFPYLRHTGPEVQQILKNQSADLKIDTISGSRATDVEILKKIKNYNIVHFASHSYFTAQRPFASGIVLSKDSKSDGIITAYDLVKQSDITTPIDLVTLSSCQGAGGTTVSNGSLGLTYALLNSNVSNVISSVQEVNDKVGMTFMDLLYKSIAGGAPLESGIQTAKLAIKKQYGSRKFWNNFNLYIR